MKRLVLVLIILSLSSVCFADKDHSQRREVRILPITENVKEIDVPVVPEDVLYSFNEKSESINALEAKIAFMLASSYEDRGEIFMLKKEVKRLNIELVVKQNELEVFDGWEFLRVGAIGFIVRSLFN